MASERVSYTDEFIRSLSQNDHVLVAEVEGGNRRASGFGSERARLRQV
jgi:hypothetical protein